MPVHIAMRAVPRPSQARDLVKRNWLSAREFVPLTPAHYVLVRMKRENHRAMLVHIIPGTCRRNRKMHQHLFEAYRMAIQNLDRQWLRLATHPRVYRGLASHESGYSKGTPDARSPPTQAATLNPVRSRSRRKRMNDPWLAHMGMQDNSVTLRQRRQSSLDLDYRHLEPCRQLRSGWTTSRIDQICDQFVVEER